MCPDLILRQVKDVWLNDQVLKKIGLFVANSFNESTSCIDIAYFCCCAVQEGDGDVVGAVVVLVVLVVLVVILLDLFEEATQKD